MSTLAVLVESSEGDQIKSFSTRKTLAEANFCMLFRVVTLAGVPLHNDVHAPKL